METKNLSMDSVKKMGLEELNTVLNTNKSLTPVMKQAIQTRIKSLTIVPAASTPVEQVQENIAAEATTAPEESKTEEVVVLDKTPKNKPGETTRTIEKFKDDTKGIRAGAMVTFLENKNPGAKTITGQVQRLFDFWNKPERQEAKIMVTGADGKTKTRFYKFEKDITPVVAPKVEEPKVEVAEGEGI